MDHQSAAVHVIDWRFSKPALINEVGLSIHNFGSSAFSICIHVSFVSILNFGQIHNWADVFQ